MRFAQILFTGTLEDGNTARPLQQAVNYAKAAERLGWDEVWTTEHQFNPHVVNPCALTLASYLLGHTERLTIGTGVVVLPHTHPVRLTSQASLLQHLSGGRLRLGLGRGGQTLELGLFGDLDRWRSRFADDLAEIKHLLATGDVQGDLHTDVPLVPTPIATPLVV
ncbi:MAG: LLM class flavin-dependent oxidoreductase, partial [Deinococcota bacterium]